MIIGTLNGSRVRLSTAKFLPPEQSRDLEAGRNLAILWERARKAIRAEEYQPIPEPVPPPEDTRTIVESAVSAYLDTARTRGRY